MAKIARFFLADLVGSEFASAPGVRLEKETFGPVLRAARERQGVTLKQLALETKLSSELWEGLEDNDLSRWPKRVFARSYVRDYALRVGLDADEVVNEFCRLFPEWGDRRSERVMREKAQIIAHDLSWEDLPAPPDRRASDRAANAAPGFIRRHRVRLLAVSIDLLGDPRRRVVVRQTARLCVTGRRSPWCPHRIPGLSTALLGRSFGLVASEWLARMLKSLPGDAPAALLPRRKRVNPAIFAAPRFFLISSRSVQNGRKRFKRSEQCR